MALVEASAMGELSEIRNFLKLSDQVWTGGQPALEHLSKLKQEGVKVIINLRQHGEHNGELEATKATELGLRYFNVPVAYNAPQPEDADAFLGLTDEQLKNGPAFIHCTAAIRVGAFWMIRRVLRDGWTYEKAFDEANQIGLTNQDHLIQFARDYIAMHEKLARRPLARVEPQDNAKGH
jgi:protein tyrosine phosphatase (PTP) superfamily phosphohydrolase (DUF442 family)